MMPLATRECLTPAFFILPITAKPARVIIIIRAEVSRFGNIKRFAHETISTSPSRARDSIWITVNDFIRAREMTMVKFLKSIQA